MNNRKENKLFVFVAILIAIIVVLLSMTNVLYSFDKMFSDRIFQTTSATNSSIKIIAIDEKTLAECGNVPEWSRELSAQLVEKLTSEPGFEPAVIGLDILYISDRADEGDVAFAKACEDAAKQGVPVVLASNLVYDTLVSYDKNADNSNYALNVDSSNIGAVELPYESIRDKALIGFANATQDRDGYIRFAKKSVSYDGKTMEAFPVVVYKAYAEKKALDVNEPKTYGDNLYGLRFSGKSGAYEVISMADVLGGKIDSKAFADSIVLLGAYATGMQDSYHVPIQKGTQMYGVEIHANAIEALMESKTTVPVNNILFTVIVLVIALGFYFISQKLKIVFSTAIFILVILLQLLVGILLFRNGYVINIVVLPIVLILIFAYQLIGGYLVEWLKHRQTINAFKKYVAPQVVDEVSKKGEFQITLGGEKRDIAVLFVDIRGFTPMSEGLLPEQVVEILNEYLNLTTTSIFKNSGTLDKFIGDATMAVFNAPFDLDDYVYRAVCTARDIAAGSEELEKKLMERFGKSVSFGIGVNCGDAVVGNIGCDFRMDYTAIGDTVNTAARLESNAKRGQILISDNVYNRLKDRVRVTEIGAIPLKGKSNEVIVYQLDEVL